MNVKNSIADAMASETPRSSRSSQSPSVTSSNSTSHVSLTQAMNAAARPYHTHLNRTILARLPLALPPGTSDPQVYALGMRHLLPVYHAFESTWRSFVSVEPHTPTTEDLSLEEAVTLSILIHLNLPQLARADRLREDVAGLLGVGLGELESWSMQFSGEGNSHGTSSAGTEDEEGLNSAASQDDGGASDFGKSEDDIQLATSAYPEFTVLYGFVQHINRIAREKPHVLIAYGWVLYMALFNGGRWIRAQLSKARDSWGSSLTAITNASIMQLDRDERGLSFWHFDGAHDGEDLKDEFKARMKDVEPMLTEEQKEDIIQESVFIFKAISRLIEEIDDLMLSRASQQSQGSEDKEPVQEDMVSSSMLLPRWETPLGYLRLLVRYLLPLGFFELILLVARLVQRLTVRFPLVMKWNVHQDVMAAKKK